MQVQNLKRRICYFQESHVVVLVFSLVVVVVVIVVVGVLLVVVVAVVTMFVAVITKTLVFIVVLTFEVSVADKRKLTSWAETPLWLTSFPRVFDAVVVLELLVLATSFY